MIEFQFTQGDLPPDMQAIVTQGFERHSAESSAPRFSKERYNWLAYDQSGTLVGALTSDLLWDWLYIDELWVSESCRGQGLGKQLMLKAEKYAVETSLSGIWLWTQSWQAGGFYTLMGYHEFTRFPYFPQGHERIGFRKTLTPK